VFWVGDRSLSSERFRGDLVHFSSFLYLFVGAILIFLIGAALVIVSGRLALDLNFFSLRQRIQ
jgi:hypothetical protein